MVKKLYIFRHGATDWNREGRFQGHRDVLLNSEGQIQAQGLRTFFGDKLISEIYSSDLNRAQASAALALGVELNHVTPQPELREINLGEAEGLTKEQIVEKFGEDVWRRWIQEDPDFMFRNGESKVQAARRVFRALELIATKSGTGDVAICTHGFVLRIFLGEVGYKIERIANCQGFEIEYSRSLFRVIKSFQS